MIEGKRKDEKKLTGESGMKQSIRKGENKNDDR